MNFYLSFRQQFIVLVCLFDCLYSSYTCAQTSCQLGSCCGVLKGECGCYICVNLTLVVMEEVEFPHFAFTNAFSLIYLSLCH